MSWIGGTRSYDRIRILGAATRARARKKRHKAIALYRCVLACERGNADLHAKLAPLLAETGQTFDAWVSFQFAARAQLRNGQVDKAISIYRDATSYLPQEIQAWLALARLHLDRGNRADAVDTLLEGACQFRSRWLWPKAIQLLRRIHNISPWEFDAVYELSRLLSKSDQGMEARRLLDGLEVRATGDRLRRIYASQFAQSGDLRYAWLWLRTAFRPEVETSFG